jgi:hypothetical protein
MSDATKNGDGTIHTVRSRPGAVFMKYASNCRTNFLSATFSTSSTTNRPCSRCRSRKEK